MKKATNRFLSLLTAAAMTLTAVPVTPIFAQEDADSSVGLIAEFDFENEAVDGEIADTTGNAKAIVNGTDSYADSYNYSQAASMGSGFWMDVTDADGGPLLKGLEEITISYDSKPAGSGNNGWTFFAAQNKNKPTHLYETYLGIMDTTSEVKVERFYDNPGSRPTATYHQENITDWKHVDVVVAETETRLYINGELKHSMESSNKLSDIMSAGGGILMVGKATWGNEYFTGLMDNFRIYDGVLTDEEIEAQYGDLWNDEIEGLIADFDFEDGVTAGEITDATGNAKAAIKEPVLAAGPGTAVYSESYDGTSAAAFNSDFWLDVTDADGEPLLKGLEEITVSFDSKTASSGEYTGWVFYASNDTSSPDWNVWERYLGIMDLTNKITVERYNSKGNGRETPASAASTAKWKHVDMVITETETKLYVDGVLADTAVSSRKLSDILSAGGGVLQIGKANWTVNRDDGEYYDGLLDNLRIYDNALKEDDIELQYKKLWDGVNVIDPEEAIQRDYDALEVYNADDVKGNLYLAESGEYGSAITWKSEDPAMITDEEQGGKAPGVVNRPVGGREISVKLTATLTLGAETLTKEFIAKVQPIPEDLDTDYSAGYLWTYFSDSNREPSGQEGGGTSGTSLNKIFYGFSEDGLHWDTINIKGNNHYPIAESTVGDKGVRDPHVIRSYDGDKYWILGTDLQGNWSQTNGSQNILVWESEDLITWTKSRAEVIWDLAGCVWAPEAMYDESTGEYLVYWASRDQRDNGTKNSALRMYVSRTRDFHTFTEAQLWADEHDPSDSEKNIIDSSLAYVNGNYYRFSTSDWYTVVDYSETLSDDFYSAVDDTPDSDWKRIMYRGEHSKYGLDSMEGLTTYQLPDGRWCAMGDNSAYRGFVIEEEDFHSMNWTKLSSGSTSSKSNSFRVGSSNENFRHGTVMRMSATEEKAVMEAYGGYDTYEPETKYVAAAKNATSDPFMSTAGTTVTFTADADTKTQEFSHWESDDITLTEVQRTSRSISITMPEEDVTLTAVYDEVTDYDGKRPESDENGMFYSEDFEDFTPDSQKGMTLHGNAAVADEDGNKVLKLTGATGGYASLPTGWIDGLDQFTISMDVKTQKADGNFFTLAIGKDTQSYIFLRTRETEFASRITNRSYNYESAADASISSALNTWKNVTMVFDGKAFYLYIDGRMAAKNLASNYSVSDLGSDLETWFGRSFYSADGYFAGAYDNIKMYDRALDEFDVAELNDTSVLLISDVEIGTTVEQPSMGSDEHTAVFSAMDDVTYTISSYVKKYSYDIATNTMTPMDTSSIPVTFTLLRDEVEIYLDGEAFINGSETDLSNGAVFTFKYGDMTDTWTVETPKAATNPVLPGKYADPDIDKFGDKYWIFPTTDGYDGWGGKEFHAFYAYELGGPWYDAGVILNTDRSVSPYQNINGVDVAISPWSTGNAWAPCIEEKDGKYYFYYCGNDATLNSKAIGVAVADDPAGPYTPKDTALVNNTVVRNSGSGISMGQHIDPDVITAEDGRHILYWGNGSCAAVELNDDMMSIKPETMQQIVQTNGSSLTGFREAISVQYYDGQYHFLWSQDDTGSPNYKVQYGVSDDPMGPVQYKYILLELNSEMGMLGTAHQATFVDEDGSVYLVYHRFYTPVGQNVGGLGYNRETCINELPYDEESGLFLAIQPTYEGVDGPIVLKDGSIYEKDEEEPLDNYVVNYYLRVAKQVLAENGDKMLSQAKAELTDAIAYAESLKADATQEQIVKAVVKLVLAIAKSDWEFGDTDALADLVLQAENVIAENPDLDATDLEKALEDAYEILNNPEEYLQDEVDEVLGALQDAYEEFIKGIVQLSWTDLQILIAVAEGVFAETTEDMFFPDSYASLKAAYEAAAYLYENQTGATQEDIDAAADDLRDALAGIRMYPDKSKLAAAVGTAKQVLSQDMSIYTIASVLNLQRAQEAGAEVLADETLTHLQQSVIDDAEKKIVKALNELEEKVPKENNKPDPGSEEEDNNDDGTTGAVTSNNTSSKKSDGSDSSSSKGGAAKSGDMTNLTWFNFLIIAAGVFGALVYRRKKSVK